MNWRKTGRAVVLDIPSSFHWMQLSVPKLLLTYLFGASCNQGLIVPSSYKSELILGGDTGLGQGQRMKWPTLKTGFQK